VETTIPTSRNAYLPQNNSIESFVNKIRGKRIQIIYFSPNEEMLTTNFNSNNQSYKHFVKKKVEYTLSKAFFTNDPKKEKQFKANFLLECTRLLGLNLSVKHFFMRTETEGDSFVFEELQTINQIFFLNLQDVYVSLRPALKMRSSRLETDSRLVTGMTPVNMTTFSNLDPSPLS
jgi:hypothetical protein